MQRLAFKMRLLPGHAAEYEKRHDAIWPEMSTLLKRTGISDYGIWLDPDGVTLFAALGVVDPEALAALANEPVVRRWWSFMADIMETNADESPIVTPLARVFFLP